MVHFAPFMAHFDIPLDLPHAGRIADRIVDLERSIGLFLEGDLQSAMLKFHWVIDGANWMYVNSHFIVTTSFQSPCRTIWPRKFGAAE